MARLPHTPWPSQRGSVFFSSAAAPATLQRAVKAGRVRRLAHGLYTADLDLDPAALIDRNRWSIVAALIPDALIADRSAANNGQPQDGVLHVVSNQRSRDLELPGLVVSPRKGPGPLASDATWAGGLRVASDARILIDNLALSRARAGKPARTLSRAELGDWLVEKTRLRPAGWLSNLRENLPAIAHQLDAAHRIEPAQDLIDVVAGMRQVHSSAGPLMRARAAGGEWDPQRVARFSELATYLAEIPADVDVPDFLPTPKGDLDTTMPFYEAYFSNFIEGTEFSVAEAEHIVSTGMIPANRPADAHDVLGTYRVVSDPVGRAVTPQTADEFLDLLQRRHQAIMAGRPELRPGEFKARLNQAGSYVFVHPDLVTGTLLRGFRYLEALPHGFARAVFQLFLISEVHPFDDGNGRVARTFMCAELSACQQARLLIPIVYRNEYQTALRALSRDGKHELYVRTLAHAWRWSAGMPWHDRAAVEGRLEATNALVDSTDAQRGGLRLVLP